MGSGREREGDMLFAFCSHRSSTACSRNMCCTPEVLCRFLHRQILIGVCAARYPGAAIFDPETNAVHCAVKGHAKDNEKCTCRHDAGILKACRVANPNCPVRGHAPASFRFSAPRYGTARARAGCLTNAHACKRVLLM
jgi:hypothetical protein